MISSRTDPSATTRCTRNCNARNRARVWMYKRRDDDGLAISDWRFRDAGGGHAVVARRRDRGDHRHAFIRLKLALTENNPTVKPYNEKTFAELPDHRLPIDVSLALLDGLHAR